MVSENTPPSSPYDGIMEDEGEAEEVEIYEEDVDELADDDIGQEAMGEDDDEEEDIEGAELLETIRDDAVFVFQKHTGSVFCCNLHPNGSLAVTGGEDDTAYVWELVTGNVVLECTGHKDSVTCAEFSRDGTYLATGDMSGVIQVWKVDNKTLVWETTIGDLSWLKWHHGTNVLFGASVIGDVYMWKIPSGDCKILAGHGEKTDCGLILPDGKRGAVGYDDGSIKVFDLKAGTALHHVAGSIEGGLMTCMDAHADNNLLIASSTSGRVSLVKTQTGKLVSMLDCNPPNRAAVDTESSKQSVEAVGFCRDNSLPIAATGTLEGYLTLWDTGRMVQRHMIKQDSGITRLVWDSKEPTLYTAGLDGIIRKYDGRSGTLLSQFSGFRGEILDIAHSADGKTILAGSDDTTARVFNTSNIS